MIDQHVETVDAILTALDFDSDIQCESTLETTPHSAQWIMVCSCGCAPALCDAMVGRAEWLMADTDTNTICLRCSTPRVRISRLEKL